MPKEWLLINSLLGWLIVFINIILLLNDKQTAGTLYTWLINRIFLVYVFSEKVIDVMNILKLSILDNSHLVNPLSILHHIQETYFALFKCLRIMSYSGTWILRRAKGLGKFVRANEVLLYWGSFPYILLLLGQRKLFVIPMTLICWGSLYQDSSILDFE